MKYTIYFPEASVEALKKLASKVQKNVAGSSIQIGEPYERVFTHSGVNEFGPFKYKVTHVICDVTVEFPEHNDWCLLATYEDGMPFITDMSKKLEFSNPNHGADCHNCDICGHWMKNSYVIRNVKTGEELQVGGECVKKYGVNYLRAISSFVSGLYGLHAMPCTDDDEYPEWTGGEDKGAFSSIEAIDLFYIAKKHYDENKGKWTKGWYDNDGIYHRSYSSECITNAVLDNAKRTEESETYYKEICEYIKNNIHCNSDFEFDMMRVCTDYYVRPSDGAYAFFAIKNYEEYLECKRLGLDTIPEGSLTRVTGRIVRSVTHEGYYGPYTIHEIKTNKGYTVFRNGVVPFTESNNEKLVDFYAFVKCTEANGKLTLDRALKRPKKGFEIIQL